MLYWGIFPFRMRFIDLHGFAWSPPFRRYMLSCWSIFVLLWFPSGAFLSHSVRLILSDTIVILWWIYFQHIISHIIISVEYMSDFLDILIGVSLSQWHTPCSFHSWSFSSHRQTRLLASSLVEHLGWWQTLSLLVTLVDHCWVTKADQHAYTFWVVDSLTLRYKGD